MPLAYGESLDGKVGRVPKQLRLSCNDTDRTLASQDLTSWITAAGNGGGTFVVSTVIQLLQHSTNSFF